jgi:Arc/MetJ family transcription regulator
MATNVKIDGELVRRAVELGRHPSKKAAVRQALIEYVQRLEQEKILSMFGTIDYARGYHYKMQRSRA